MSPRLPGCLTLCQPRPHQGGPCQHSGCQNGLPEQHGKHGDSLRPHGLEGPCPQHLLGHEQIRGVERCEHYHAAKRGGDGPGGGGGAAAEQGGALRGAHEEAGARERGEGAEEAQVEEDDAGVARLQDLRDQDDGGRKVHGPEEETEGDGVEAGHARRGLDGRVEAGQEADEAGDGGAAGGE